MLLKFDDELQQPLTDFVNFILFYFLKVICRVFSKFFEVFYLCKALPQFFKVALQLFTVSLTNINDDSSDDEDQKPKPTLSHEAMQRLAEMRASNQLCDAVIKTSDGTAYNVHRTIMGACSEYFR